MIEYPHRALSGDEPYESHLNDGSSGLSAKHISKVRPDLWMGSHPVRDIEKSDGIQPESPALVAESAAKNGAPVYSLGND